MKPKTVEDLVRACMAFPEPRPDFAAKFQKWRREEAAFKQELQALTGKQN